MQVHPVVQQRVDEREPDGAAEIAGEIEQAGGVLERLRRQRAQREIVDRHHAQHQRGAAQDLRNQQFVEIPILGDVWLMPGAKAEAEKADRRSSRAGRASWTRMPGDRRGEEHAAPVTNIVSPIISAS
jgi:hypothetical protein